MLKHQETVLPIFVYGTLMVGERNYIDVLHDNLTHVENAKVKGTLYYYKKEDYPALMPGEHWIEGQLFYVNELHEVLKPLDEIEGYISKNNPGNMYNRDIVEVVTEDGKCYKLMPIELVQIYLSKSVKNFQKCKSLVGKNLIKKFLN